MWGMATETPVGVEAECVVPVTLVTVQATWSGF